MRTVHPDRTRLARATGLGALLAAGSLTAAGATGRAAVLSWPGGQVVPVDRAVVPLVLAAAAGLLLWTAVVLARAAAHTARAAAHGRDHGADLGPGRPTSVRVACALLVGLAGLTPTLASAQPTVVATQPGPHPAPSAGGAGLVGGEAGAELGSPDPVTSTELPQPGWTPTTTRPAPPPAPATTVGLVSDRPGEDLPDHVVVRRGDTLWDIAARHLGAGATATDIAEAWPRWYDLNRDVVGDDPDLLLPGQELRVPALEGR